MDKKQFGTLVKGMKAVYPDPKFIPDKDAFDVWYSLLNDLEYEPASMAIQKYMMINKFPPTIADIRSSYVSIVYPKELDETQAWEIVIDTIAQVEKSGLATKKFEALSILIQKAIGGKLEFLELINNKNGREIAKSNFIKAYAKLLDKDNEMKMLKPEIRSLIEANRPVGIEENIVHGIEENNRKEVMDDEEWWKYGYNARKE